MNAKKKRVNCNERKGKQLNDLYIHKSDKCRRQFDKNEIIKYLLPLMWRIIWNRIRKPNDADDACIDSYILNMFDCDALPEFDEDNNLFKLFGQ